MDLIPPALIVARYFADEQAKLDELTAAAEEATRAVEEYVEEHAVEEGLLAEAMDDDKITKALVDRAAARSPSARAPTTTRSRRCEHVIKLYDAEAAAKKAVKEAQAELDLADAQEVRRSHRGRREERSCSTTSGTQPSRAASSARSMR